MSCKEVRAGPSGWLAGTICTLQAGLHQADESCSARGSPQSLTSTAGLAQIKVMHSPSLRDAFAAEIVKLSPQELHTVDFSGSSNLHKVVVSPMTACPNLVSLNLSQCATLEYIMLQSSSLKFFDAQGCGALVKVRRGRCALPSCVQQWGTSVGGQCSHHCMCLCAGVSSCPPTRGGSACHIGPGGSLSLN
jgi:hypothetical protein